MTEVDAARLLDRLADAVVVAGTDDRIRYVNAAVTAMLGWSPEDLLGGPLARIMPARMQGPHAAGMARYVATGRTTILGGLPIRVPALRADGAEIPVDLTIGVEAGPDGILFVATLRDVTDRVELERRLALADYLKAGLDVARALSVATSVDEGFATVLPSLSRQLDWDLAVLWRRASDDGPEVLRASDVVSGDVGDAGELEHFSDFLAVTRSELFSPGEGLCGRAWELGEPVLAEDLRDVLTLRRAAAERNGLASGIAFPLLGATRVYGVVEMFSRTPRRFDDELPDLLSQVGRQFGQFLDRMRSEEVLRESESRYRLLVEATSLDMWRATVPDGVLISDMPHWRTITGQSREEIAGAGWLDAVVPDDRSRTQEAWLAAVRTGGHYGIEYRIRGRGGRERLISARGVPITTPSGATEYVGTCLDVTEQRSAEAASAALAEALARALLPPRLPQPRGLAVASAYRVGGDGMAVGGDFYDLFPVGGAWDAVIGDVRGKGAEAAAVTGLARYTLRAAAIEHDRPSEVLRVLNEVLLREDDAALFLTASHARIRPGRDGAVVTLANAGHPLPMLVRPDATVTPVGEPGSLSGVLDEPDLIDTEVLLRPGETLVFYTDGVTEARRSGVEFGEDGLVAVLAASARLTVSGMVSAVENAVLAHRESAGGDDLAVLALRATACGEDDDSAEGRTEDGRRWTRIITNRH